jgi:hypothetical protein
MWWQHCPDKLSDFHPTLIYHQCAFKGAISSVLTAAFGIRQSRQAPRSAPDSFRETGLNLSHSQAGGFSQLRIQRRSSIGEVVFSQDVYDTPMNLL